jgi:hypothetical protein
MAAKLTRLTHKIAIQLHLVAKSCTICSFRSRRPVRKLSDTPSHVSKLPDNLIVCYFSFRYQSVCKVHLNNRCREMFMGSKAEEQL